MNRTGFASTCTLTASNPAKHVKYTLGMVLGVDDFEQEFAYHDGHLRWAIRDLHGYGTVNGLSVKIEATTTGPRIRIGKGAAVMPSGHLVCVPMDQCAFLNQWLQIDAHQTAIEGHIVTDGLDESERSIRLHVVLCYRCCPTDPMPIPGEPCRSEDSLTSPSRLLDDFVLELRVEPPAQTEHQALQRFIEWLKLIPVVESGSTISKDEFLQAIRDSFMTTSPSTSPPSEEVMMDPPLTVGSPPEDFQINQADVSHYFRAASSLWVTEVRPNVHPLCMGVGPTSCCDHEEATAESTKHDETCLLLAAVDVPLTSTLTEVDSGRSVVIDEQDRPILFSTQLIQRWMAAPVENAMTSPPTSMVPLSLRAIAPGATDTPVGGEVRTTSGRVIAAGQFDRAGNNVVPSFGELRARFLENQFIYLLQSPHIRKDRLTIIRATAITTPGSSVSHVIEAIEASANTLGLPAATLRNALAVRVRQSNGRQPTQSFSGFTVEITEYDQ